MFFGGADSENQGLAAPKWLHSPKNALTFLLGGVFENLNNINSRVHLLTYLLMGKIGNGRKFFFVVLVEITRDKWIEIYSTLGVKPPAIESKMEKKYKKSLCLDY